MPKIIIILWLLSFSLMNHSSALNKFVWRQTDKAVVKKFLVQHCYDCHDTDIQKGELDLESMNFDMSSRDMLYKWSRVHEMIEHGDMPPKKKKRPAAQEKENVLKALARTLQVADKQVETLMEKRLGNKEIEYVLQDIFGTYINSAHLLPEAEGTSGFDNQTVDLRISTDFMLRYSDFLDEFLEEFFNPQKSQKVSNSKSKINTKEISKRVQITQGGIYRLTTVFNPPKNVREARVLVSVSSYPRMKSHPVMLDRKKNRKVVLETALYKNDSYLYQANIYKKENLIASSYLLEGPIGKMAKFKSLTGCETGSEMSIANGLTLLKKVLPLLYSRNTKNELTKYKREISVNKQSPDDAAKKVIKRALLSIEFLYGVDIRKNGQLSDISIAKRMARMLWRSVPDLQLLKLAVQKKLSNPLVRRQQSLRMMQDPRFGRFKKDFFTFWLGTREFYSRENPTKDAFPEFYKQGESLVLYSLYEQFNLYLNDLVDNNRSIVELIGSNWTYANDLINKNYRLGIKNMGSDFKRVQLSEESLHGGLLTQGVLMRLTSSVNDSSPVKRGVWILENFLAVKVPSPPPVAGFEPDIVGAKSLKEQFMMHREHKSCASCHEKIDPIGFLFESLGPLGKERKSYPLAKGKAAKIDREPMVFNGVTFKSINEFKKYILKHAEETIVKSYMEKLVTYSFGRSQDFSDKLTIKSILKNNPQFKVRDLIRDFCTSSMFVK